MHRLSLAHLTIDNAEPFELIDAAARAGFDSVGLRVISAPGAPARPSVAGNPGLISRLAASVAENGLDVLQVNSFWITPETTADTFAPVVEAAARLGARNVLVVISDPDAPRAAARFAECCAAAEPLGIHIALEFQSYSPVRTVTQALRMIETSSYGNAGLVVDALHLDRGEATRPTWPWCRRSACGSSSFATRRPKNLRPKPCAARRAADGSIRAKARCRYSS